MLLLKLTSGQFSYYERNITAVTCSYVPVVILELYTAKSFREGIGLLNGCQLEDPWYPKIRGKKKILVIDNGDNILNFRFHL